MRIQGEQQWQPLLVGTDDSHMKDQFARMVEYSPLGDEVLGHLFTDSRKRTVFQASNPIPTDAKTADWFGAHRVPARASFAPGSLLFSFNEALHAYLHTVYDHNAQQFYQKTISRIADFSGSIIPTHTRAFPDIISARYGNRPLFTGVDASGKGREMFKEIIKIGLTAINAVAHTDVGATAGAHKNGDGKLMSAGCRMFFSALRTAIQQRLPNTSCIIRTILNDFLTTREEFAWLASNLPKGSTLRMVYVNGGNVSGTRAPGQRCTTSVGLTVNRIVNWLALGIASTFAACNHELFADVHTLREFFGYALLNGAVTPDGRGDDTKVVGRQSTTALVYRLVALLGGNLTSTTWTKDNDANIPAGVSYTATATMAATKALELNNKGLYPLLLVEYIAYCAGTAPSNYHIKGDDTEHGDYLDHLKGFWLYYDNSTPLSDRVNPIEPDADMFMRIAPHRPESIVYQSTHMLLQTAMRGEKPAGVTDRAYITHNLAGISDVTKDQMRGQLPYFRRMFETMHSTCEFMRSILELKGFKDVSRTFTSHAQDGVLGFAFARELLGQGGGMRYIGDNLFRGAVKYEKDEPVKYFDEGEEKSLISTGAVFVTPGDQGHSRFFSDESAEAFHTIWNNGATAAALQETFRNYSDACRAMLVTCDEVIEELQDGEFFLEAREGDLARITKKTGHPPYSPASLALHYARPSAIGLLQPSSKVLPFGQYDTAASLRRGGRLFTTSKREITAQNAPGIQAVVDRVNAVVTGRESLDAETMYTAAAYIREAIQGLSGTTMFAGELVRVTHGYPLAPNALSTRLLVRMMGARLPAESSMTFVDDAAEIIDIVGREDVKTAYAKVAKQVRKICGRTHVTMGGDRKEQQVQNIADLNIIPISFNMLARDIPFAGIYNYAYTFEEIVCRMFGFKRGDIVSKAGDETRAAGTLTRPQRLFLNMFIDPYREVTEAEFTISDEDAPLCRIFRGNDGLGLGRPKFLSDEVFNKALLGSLYPGPGVYDVAGPASSASLTVGVRARGVGTDPAATPVFRDTAIAIGSRIGSTDTANATKLFYVKRTGDKTDTVHERDNILTEVDIPASLQGAVHRRVSRARFATPLVRNLFFLTNLQRVILHGLNQDQMRANRIIASDQEITRTGLTEYDDRSHDRHRAFLGQDRRQYVDKE
jgi:hypothetical protein